MDAEMEPMPMEMMEELVMPTNMDSEPKDEIRD